MNTYLLIFLALLTVVLADPEASAHPSPDAALVTNHGHPHLPPRRAPHHPHPSHGLSSVFDRSTLDYGPSTPSYDHVTPIYGHTTPIYGYSPPEYEHITPAYGFSTPSPYHKPISLKPFVHHAKIPKTHQPSYHKAPKYYEISHHEPPKHHEPSYQKPLKYHETSYQDPPKHHEPSYQESPKHHEPSYQEPPKYHKPSYQEPPKYHKPSYQEPPKYHKPSYQEPPKYHEPHKHCGDSAYEKLPSCSYNTTKSWCLEDYEYPEYEIKSALEFHKEAVLSQYADVFDLNTANSVVRPNSIKEETYLCPSDTTYANPRRAVNTEGKWKIIVNKVKVDYDSFTQTARIEECIQYGKPCALVPHCYESSCLQKSVYHRFLVYDPCDKHLPFSVESFKLPSTCACHLGAYYLVH